MDNYDKNQEVLSYFTRIGKVFLEAILFAFFADLLSHWFGLTSTQGLVLLLSLYLIAQLRFLFSELQFQQSLHHFLDNVNHELWENDDSEEKADPPRHLTRIYPFEERKKDDDE